MKNLRNQIAIARSFNNSTLDGDTTGVLPFVSSFWDCATIPCAQKAPFMAANTGGALRAATSTVVATGGQIDLPVATDYAVASVPWSPGVCEYTISFLHTPDDGTPSVESNIVGIPGSVEVNMLTDGKIRVYHNGASSWVDSSVSVFTTGVSARVTITKRFVTGTLTVFVYVNGTERINTTALDPTVAAGVNFFLGGTYGTSSIGLYSNVYIIDRGISAAEETLLGANPLTGVGI